MLSNYLIERIYEFPVKQRLEEIRLEDKDLNVEQIPQIIHLFHPNKISWKLPLVLEGPDGTQINIESSSSSNVFYGRAPINKNPIGWMLKKNNQEVFKNLLQHLLPCKEGSSYFNPSPWNLYSFLDDKLVRSEPGYVSQKINEVSNENIALILDNKTLTITHNFLNPKLYIINPFYIQEFDNFEGKFTSSGFSVELQETISFVSDGLMEVEVKKGEMIIHNKGSRLVKIKGENWKENKILQFLWNLINEVFTVDCTIEKPISLYEIIPYSVIPITINFVEDKLLYIILFNASDSPVFATFRIAAKIEKAFITDIYGSEIEQILSEFDRIKIPMKRWGILPLKLEILKIPERLILRRAL
ncbi:MAG: hypothetical protein OWQ54_03660 [Sulfolobaceae archaeon]|nr:hypothetical protein [Sulfolobaceae archaeon]